MFVWIFTTLTTAAGGGGGGGGGGGATKPVSNVALGRASVNSSGINTMTPTRMISMMNVNEVVKPRLVFSLLPDSIRLSSNIRFPLHCPYFPLDPACHYFAPTINFCLLAASTEQNGLCLLEARSQELEAYLLLPARNGLGRDHAGRPSSFDPPILIGHQNRRRDRDRRIRPD